MINWQDSLARANLLAWGFVLLAFLALPLALVNLPAVPFLGLKQDPLSGGGGYEPFAMELTLMMQTRDNEFIAKRLNPEVWKEVGISKAQSRMYARAMTAAPKLPSEDWAWVLTEELNRPDSPLALALKVPGNISSVSLSVKSLTPGRDDTWLLETTP